MSKNAGKGEFSRRTWMMSISVINSMVFFEYFPPCINLYNILIAYSVALYFIPSDFRAAFENSMIVVAY